MAQTPENKVKTWLRLQMKNWYPNAWHYALPGGMFGKVGAPDDMWVIGDEEFSVTVFIESKAEGNTVTVAQWNNLMQLKSQGAIVAVMTGRDIAKLLKIRVAIETRLTKYGVLK